MGGGVGHPPAAARRAESATLARVREQAVLATGIAVDAQETAGQHATIEERPQFPLYEAGNASIPAVLPFQEGFEMPGDNAVEDALGRVSRAVDRRGFPNLKVRRKRREVHPLSSNFVSYSRSRMCVGHCAWPTCLRPQASTSLTARFQV